MNKNTIQQSGQGSHVEQSAQSFAFSLTQKGREPEKAEGGEEQESVRVTLVSHLMTPTPFVSFRLASSNQSAELIIGNCS